MTDKREIDLALTDSDELIRLALELFRGGADADAIPLVEHALAIRVNILGPEDPRIAEPLQLLASLRRAQRDYALAEQLAAHALNILEAALGACHPRLVPALHNVADLYHAREAYRDAEQHYRRALRIQEDHQGAEHVGLVPSLCLLARNLQLQDRSHEAKSHYRRALGILDSAYGADHRQHAVVLTELGWLYHLEEDEDEAEPLLLRGLAVRERVDPEHPDVVESVMFLGAFYRDQNDYVKALSYCERALRLREDGAGAEHPSVAEPLEILASLHLQKGGHAQAESLYRRILVIREQAFGPDHADVAATYLLTRNCRPTWLPLGDAEVIDAAVTAALRVLNRPGDDPREPLRALDELVFAPIRRQLGAIDHFLISPDGALHLVPFAALIDEQGRYAVEHMLITYLTSGRDLLRPATPADPRPPPLVLAAPAYGARWAELPGTAAEAAALQRYFADAEVYVGSAATRDRLLTARGPRILHIGCHGYFGARSSTTQDTQPSRAARDIILEDRVSAFAAEPRVDIENALDDAGLIFAGEDDATAVLTARDIAAVDLNGTQLVVLSACDTGVGEIADSEGVYGLRRAIVVAGAETQVVSLWKVDDKVTSHLMERYYEGLSRGVGRSAALRDAQLALLGDGSHAHPCYWAAFIPIGNEDPL